MARKILLAILTAIVLTIITGCSSPERKDTSKLEPARNKEELPQNKNEVSSPEEGKVISVVDGDTIVVLTHGVKEKVRLIGIDTPEVGRPYFNEAREKTEKLVLGKTVTLKKDVSERDKYGRLLRYVYVGNLFVNAELVRQGYAMVYTYPPDVKYADYFLKLQREAREKGLGLWAPPKKSSTQNKFQEKVTYVASRNREPFHYPWCTWAKKISPYNLETFSSREEAIRAGHRPCKVCNP